MGAPLMRRRSFLRGTVAALALLTTGCAAPQPRARMLRIGAFTGEAMPADGSRPQLEADIMEGLHTEGLVPGTNMTIEWRHAQGDVDLFPIFATELVDLPVDILIAATTNAAVAAKEATTKLPIVMEGAGDPVEAGLVRSYSHPGGNITGTAFSNGVETAKRLELLREAFPLLRRVVLIGIVANTSQERIAVVRQAADSLHMGLDAPLLRTDDDVAHALDGIGGDDGLALMGSALTFQNTARIIAFAAQHRIPAVYSREQDVRAGGLMSYGSDRREMRLGVGKFVRRIADGAYPGDLPVQLPAKFDLAVSLATAKRAGFSLPPSVMARATTVIE